MNVQQMHVGVRLGVQKINSSEASDLLPQEIDYYLNNSITDFVKEQYTLLKNSSTSLQGQFVNENLRRLIVHLEISGATTFNRFPNAISFSIGSLAQPYEYYLFSQTYLHNIGKKKVNIPIQPTGIQHYLRSEFNNPLFRKLPVIISGDEIIVLGDDKTDFTPVHDRLDLTYIRSAPQISLSPTVNPDFLPSHTHKQIVDYTVSQILIDLQLAQQTQQ